MSDQPRGHDILTHSRRQTFKTCQRRHFIKYELGIRRREQTSEALRIGSAFHNGLDARRRGKSADEAVAVAMMAYQEYPSWCTTRELEREWFVEAVQVKSLLEGYWNYWDGDGIPADVKVVEVIESEQQFRLPIINPDTGACGRVFQNAGKRDGIVRCADGRRRLFETKTTKIVNDDYWLKVSLDSQISDYLNAAVDEGLLDAADNEVLYDVIIKPSMWPKDATPFDKRKYTKKGELYKAQRDTDEPLDEYEARLRADIAINPGDYYLRRSIPRLASTLSESAADLWAVQKSIREAQLTGRHFRNTSQCVGFGRCEYIDICPHNLTRQDPPHGYVAVDDLHPELGVEE